MAKAKGIAKVSRKATKPVKGSEPVATVDSVVNESVESVAQAIGVSTLPAPTGISVETVSVPGTEGKPVIQVASASPVKPVIQRAARVVLEIVRDSTPGALDPEGFPRISANNGSSTVLGIPDSIPTSALIATKSKLYPLALLRGEGGSSAGNATYKLFRTGETAYKGFVDFALARTKRGGVEYVAITKYGLELLG